MKYLSLLVLVLCAYAHDASNIPDVAGDSVKGHFYQQSFNLHAASDVISEDDSLLSTELTELDREQGRSLVGNLIQDLLESFRPVVINGNDQLPPLDPLSIAHVGPFFITATGIRVTTNLHNFNLDGLRWYVVDDVTFNTLRLALGVKVTVPWLTATGSYDLRARITLLTHEAGGNFRVFINRLETSVDARVGTNIFGGGTLILRELDIKIVIHDINIQIEGMVGSNILNSLINSFVQSTAQNLLRDELDTISQTLSRELFDTINEILGNFTIDDLLG